MVIFGDPYPSGADRPDTDPDATALIDPAAGAPGATGGHPEGAAAPARRRPTVLIGACVAAIVIGVGGAVYAGQQADDARPSQEVSGSR